jgi:hypothetical protein
MQVDLNHVLFWMDAIRNSEDRYRTLESFWKGQIHSKEWLIQCLRPYISDHVTIDIFGGWNGVLASLLFQSGLPIRSIRNIDVDPKCEEIAYTMNKLEEIEQRFSHVIADMCDTNSSANIVINTSCEHVTEEQYNKWLSIISNESIIVLQSNNYQIEEHVNCSSSLSEFVAKSNIHPFFKGELVLSKYTRYLIIGKKYVEENKG